MLSSNRLKDHNGTAISDRTLNTYQQHNSLFLYNPTYCTDCLNDHSDYYGPSELCTEFSPLEHSKKCRSHCADVYSGLLQWLFQLHTSMTINCVVEPTKTKFRVRKSRTRLRLNSQTPVPRGLFFLLLLTLTVVHLPSVESTGLGLIPTTSRQMQQQKQQQQQQPIPDWRLKSPFHDPKREVGNQRPDVEQSPATNHKTHTVRIRTWDEQATAQASPNVNKHPVHPADQQTLPTAPVYVQPQMAGFPAYNYYAAAPYGFPNTQLVGYGLAQPPQQPPPAGTVWTPNDLPMQMAMQQYPQTYQQPMANARRKSRRKARQRSGWCPKVCETCKRSIQYKRKRQYLGLASNVSNGIRG